jgi:hypothetical protein
MGISIDHGPFQDLDRVVFGSERWEGSAPAQRSQYYTDVHITMRKNVLD